MDAVVYYDGDCPFCTSYVTYQKLNTVFESMALINLRELDVSALEGLKQEGLNPSEGIIMKIVNNDGETRWVKKAEVTYLLAFFENGRGRKNIWWLVNFLSKNQRHAKFWYPIFFWLRNMILVLLGRKLSF